MILKDLIVLQNSDDRYCFKFIGIRKAKKEYPDLKIDLNKKKWYWKDKNGRIGEGLKQEEYSLFENGPIGIYNRNKIKDLNNIIPDILLQFHFDDDY